MTSVDADLDVLADLDTARYLARHGVPIFRGEPAMVEGKWDPTGGTGHTGYWLPTGWQQTKPDPTVIDRWRPGDALCAVMGHTVDGLDVDPRSGGDATKAGLQQAGMWPRSYGAAATPSGGTHDLVAPLGVHSCDDVAAGLDIKAGVNGYGHGFLFIGPTVKRSKVTGEIGKYGWVISPDLDAIDEGDDSGQPLADKIRAKRNGHKKAEDDGEAARDWMAADRIPGGERRIYLLSYAGWLREKGVRYAEAEAQFRRRWRDCDQPPEASHEMPWADAKAILRDIYDRYQPGQEPPEATTLGEEPPPRRRTLADRTFTRSQLADLPKHEPLIENTLDRRTVAAVIGPQGTLKSFLLISWLCSVATGTPWLGRPVKRGPVVLIAAEGAYGINGRIGAWEQHHDIQVPDDGLRVIAGPVNLTKPSEVSYLCADIGEHAIVGIDTLARSIVGADENSAKDMGVAVDSLYRLRDATGDGTVVVAHHTPKGNGTTGRGSSAFEFGIDTIYLADGNAEGVTLTRTKRKDGPQTDVLNGHLQVVGLSGFFADKTAELSNAADALLSAFMSAFSATGTKAELRHTVPDMPPATFHRSLNSLIKLGILRNAGTDKRPFYVRAQAGQP
jgi:AAA domain